MTSDVTGGEQGGRVPPDSSDREISAGLPGKEARKKRENGAGKKENRKKEGGKLKKKMEGRKVRK